MKQKYIAKVCHLEDILEPDRGHMHEGSPSVP